jgi:hypothetical protein
MTSTQQALRYNAGKPQWNLVDFKALEPMVQVLMYGAKKYTKDGVSGAHNWKKGLPVTATIDSLMRHLTAYLGGEELDPESGLPHIGHIMCNIMFISHFTGTKWDDREKTDTPVDIGELIKSMEATAPRNTFSTLVTMSKEDALNPNAKSYTTLNPKPNECTS